MQRFGSHICSNSLRTVEKLKGTDKLNQALANRIARYDASNRPAPVIDEFENETVDWVLSFRIYRLMKGKINSHVFNLYFLIILTLMMMMMIINLDKRGQRLLFNYFKAEVSTEETRNHRSPGQVVQIPKQFKKAVNGPGGDNLRYVSTLTGAGVTENAARGLYVTGGRKKVKHAEYLLRTKVVRAVICLSLI